MSNDQDTQFNIDPKVLMVGDITYAFRGSGNTEASGTEISDIAPKNKLIPQISIGVASYNDLEVVLGGKEDNASSVSSDSGNSILNPFNSVGAVGLDGLFVPYINYRSDDGSGIPFLPHFEIPETLDIVNVTTLDPFNPFNLLNATGNTTASTGDTWFDSGHNISFALHDNPFDPVMTGIYPSGDDAPVDFNFEKDFFARCKAETSGVRSIGFRSPMVLSGWGYDIGGDPVPKSGNVLHPEATYNPNIWKTGPIDLRWDNFRKVWTAAPPAFYLSKVTNLYTPTSFSFEVDRSRTRDQYSRNAPASQRAFNSTEALYDPEYIAYVNDPDNVGQYESLDYGGIDFPYYEAFIIRSTADNVNSSSYYNIWTEDCSDCGTVQNPCASSGSQTLGAHSGVSALRKILIENPLRQAVDVGDLCFTVDTGKRKNVNSGSFSGGSVSGVAQADLVINQDGSGYINVTNSGSGYTAGGFGLIAGCDVCANITLYFQDSSPYALASGTVDPNTGLNTSGTCTIDIIPADATADTEQLPIHWIMQSEFKSQQVVTHAECSAGVLQTCTMKIQTQGFKTCEHCGEDTAFINAFT